MGEFALAVPFPGLVELTGIPNDLPPHVTLLVPSPGDEVAIAEVLKPFEAFDVSFERCARFPGVLWLAPEPAEPFVAMTEALSARFPAYPPYGGLHDEVIPHLTVAQTDLRETEHRLEPLLPLRSRADSIVLYAHVEGEHWAGVRTFPL